MCLVASWQYQAWVAAAAALSATAAALGSEPIMASRSASVSM